MRLSSTTKNDILRRLHEFEHPKRKALTHRFPILRPLVVPLRRSMRNWSNIFDPQVFTRRQKDWMPCIIARHQSVLRRKLGDSDARLQEQKVQNLRVAAAALNGIVIPPGKVFSLWHIIGQPTKKRGYANGMLLSNGRVVEGIGGGLCQMSNFLFWIFLHADTKIIERYHHSMDVFPDSGRVLPFGSGATILFNFVDLKIKNISGHPLQLKMWLTDNHLKGQLLSNASSPKKFHVFEKDHYFVKTKKQYFRYNELWRETLENGKVLLEEKITTNFAPVLYPIDTKYIRTNKFKVIDLTK